MNFSYPRNLRFQCSNCGICCGDAEKKVRHILLTKKDAERIAAFTKQAVSHFASQTGNKAPYVYEMRKRPENGKCLFHQKNHCAIYAHRPLTCRFYPFELSAAENIRHQFTVTRECPGISNLGTTQGEKVSLRFFRALFALACEELGFAAEPSAGSC